VLTGGLYGFGGGIGSGGEVGGGGGAKEMEEEKMYGAETRRPEVSRA
jgi:hypothetical protein